ncbi:DUF3072 domain-containing protein [Amycolatopsis sp. NBC_01480]
MPSEWTADDVPMTGPQESYLRTLAQEIGRAVPGVMTRAQASCLIDELQQQTGRGTLSTTADDGTEFA